MAGFVIYDTETTGLRKGFDQIVSFAAVHTDHDLNELETFEIRSKLQPHVVPAPKALLTNGFSIADLTDPTLPSHYEMMGGIARKLSDWSPATFIGYNSIRFDEEMLRHGFIQSLLDPYITSRSRSGRADAFSLALAAYATPPRCLIAPTGLEGRPSFKLADIAVANNLAHANAHHALSDAKATLELCRFVRANADDIWQRFQRFSNKATVSQFVEMEEAFVLSEFFGGGQASHRVVTSMGTAPDNKNNHFCFDLSFDPELIASLTDAEVSGAICRKGSPIRRLATNSGPALTELWAAEGLVMDLDEGTIAARTRRLKDDPDLCVRLIGIYTASWKNRELPPFPEQRLYSGGFINDADKQRMWEFHEASRESRHHIVESFEDPRLAIFGRRLFYAEHRGSLTASERLAADVDLADRLLIESGGPLTLAGAVQELDALETDNPEDRILLSEYRVWLVDRLSKVEQFRKLHSERTE